jgi:Flp pilus assembly protein TadD
LQYSLDDGLKQLAALHKEGLADQAARLLQRLLAEFPQSPAVHRARALLADAQGDAVQAIAAMQRACELAPAAIDLRFQLACLLAASSDFVNAIPNFQYVIENEPQLTEAWYLCGLALMRINRDTEALPLLRDANRRTPD